MRSTSPQSIGLEPVIDNVITMASKLTCSAMELSQSVSVLTRQNIDGRNAANVTEQLQQLAALNVIQKGARGNVTSVSTRVGEPSFAD